MAIDASYVRRNQIMNGIEIVNYLVSNLASFPNAVSAVAGGLFTAIFLRHNTAVKEFEKIKAGHLGEVAEDLLKSGEMTHTEYYKARNFLTVAKKADRYYSKMPPRDKNFDAYDFDWFIRFYEAVGNISNEEMQELWAKILAGEISHPNTFSLRTIDVLKNLNKEDARLFDKVCNHSVFADSVYFLPRYDEYLAMSGVKYSEIMRLAELGLINDSGLVVLNVEPHETNSALLVHRDLVLIFNSKDSNKRGFHINQYPFTQVGCELATLKSAGATNQVFLEFVKELSRENQSIHFEVHKFKRKGLDKIEYADEDLLAVHE